VEEETTRKNYCSGNVGKVQAGGREWDGIEAWRCV